MTDIVALVAKAAETISPEDNCIEHPPVTINHEPTTNVVNYPHQKPAEKEHPKKEEDKTPSKLKGIFEKFKTRVVNLASDDDDDK